MLGSAEVQTTPEGMRTGACVTPEGGKPQKLSLALLKVTPKVTRMRQRLDALRGRRKPVKSGPEWARKL